MAIAVIHSDAIQLSGDDPSHVAEITQLKKLIAEAKVHAKARDDFQTNENAVAAVRIQLANEAAKAAVKLAPQAPQAAKEVENVSLISEASTQSEDLKVPVFRRLRRPARETTVTT